MSEKVPAKDLVERLSRQAGVSRRLASALMRELPEIISEALNTDGEARMRGLGTFRLREVKGKTGRNPKTGDPVEIPPHKKIIFQPESSFRDYISNPDEVFGYRMLDTPEPDVIAVEFRPQEAEPEFTAPEMEEKEEPGGEVPEEGVIPEVLPSERLYDPMRAETAPLPPSKKGIHWVVPVSLAIILLLSLVFYLRNCRHELEMASVTPETTDTSQNRTPSIPETPVGDTGQTPDPEKDTNSISTENPGSGSGSVAETAGMSAGTSPEGQNTRKDTTVRATATHLFQLAREVYDNRPLLWVLIYRANRGTITNPDQAISGRDIVIPALEGTPWKLTRNDSLAVSDGYRMVYEYYLDKGDQRAGEFRQVMLKYKPK
jgi:nucleoid DNA-binding protein